MTMAVGMLCRDGVVIAADSQLSRPDYDKRYESKVHFCDDQKQQWALLFGYAGSPGLDEEVRNKILGRLRGPQPPTLNVVYAACDEVFTELGRHFAVVDLYMLIGVSCPNDFPRLLVFDGRSLHWEDGLLCFGVGDSSLTTYLRDVLYKRQLTVEEGMRLAIYIVAKAKAYIDKCSGDTAVYSIRSRGEIVGTLPEEVAKLEIEMKAREKEHMKAIIGFIQPLND